MLYQAVPSYIKLYQSVPSHTKLYIGIPSNTKLYKAVPSQSKLFQVIPSYFIYCLAWPYASVQNLKIQGEGPPNRVWIVWTAGWVEPGDKWMMVTILGSPSSTYQQLLTLCRVTADCSKSICTVKSTAAV